MRVAAPGKVFLTGAWAILRGAPAIVCAVDRSAYADDRGTPSTRPEVLAVARRLGASVPAIDVGELEHEGVKLGLGGSAAAAVAAAALVLASRGPIVPDAVLEIALAAHRDVQPRGSGADVAASALGGAIVARREGERVLAERSTLSDELVIRAFALPRAARTSDALDRLAAREHDPAVTHAFTILDEAAHGGAAAIGDAAALVRAAARHGAGLEALGDALDLPLFPPEIAPARAVLSSDLVLLPSGAGGGDTVLLLGARPPTEHETTYLHTLGLRPFPLALATRGVHVVPS